MVKRRVLLVLSAWLAGWLVLAAGVGGALWWVRGRALAELDNPTARAEWQAWRQAVERQDPQLGPVRRRPPEAQEPPAVILLRDHFGAVLLGTGLFLTMLYLFLAFVVTGMLRPEWTEDASGQPVQRRKYHRLLVRKT